MSMASIRLGIAAILREARIGTPSSPWSFVLGARFLVRPWSLVVLRSWSLARTDGLGTAQEPRTTDGSGRGTTRDEDGPGTKDQEPRTRAASVSRRLRRCAPGSGAPADRARA